ncbi:MAG: hypothetical protein ABIR25_07825 [Sphingomicrobium sp.]
MDGTPNQQINVKLTLVDEGGTAAWHMDIAGQGKGGPNAYPKADVAHGSSADFKFVITGPGTQNVSFASNNPISVSKDDGSGKSPSTPGINTDQITDVSGGGGKTLKFTDINGNPAVNLTYQLNFTGADPLDPIIQNNGGGGTKFDYATAAAVVLLFAVVAFFAVRMIQKRTTK